MKKILFATDTFDPTVSGVTVSIKRITQELQKRKIEVAIIAPSDDLLPHIKREKPMVYRVGSTPLIKRKDARLPLPGFLTAARALSEFKPEVIHIHTPGNIGLSAKLLAEQQGIPTIGTLHFSPAFAKSYSKLGDTPLFVRWLKFLFDGCVAVTTPTTLAAEEWRQLGLRLPFMTLSNGIPSQVFMAPVDPVTPGSTILHVGRIDHDKNVGTVLKAFALVHQHRPEVRLVIVGDGNRRQKLQEWVVEHGLEQAITFTGKLEPNSEEMRQQLWNARAFVTASTIETQGLVVLEAFAAGLPVVAADAGALPEIVKNGENGFLASPHKPEQYAEKLLWLLDHPAEARAMGQTGLALARQHELSAVIEKYIALYERAITHAR